MLRTMFYFLCSIVVLNPTAHASFIAPLKQDWTHIRTLSDYEVYHKASYSTIVNIKGQKRMSTWAKYVARSTKPNLLYLKKDDYVLVQLQFICPTRQYAILSGTTYLSRGQISRSSWVDHPHFMAYQPQSIEAKIAYRVCSSRRT